MRLSGEAIEDRVLAIPVSIRESAGINRTCEPVAVGVPFPRGWIRDPNALGIRNEKGKSLPLQATVMDWWPDMSIKWVLLECFASVEAGQTAEYEISNNNPVHGGSDEGISIRRSQESLSIDTGVAKFDLDVETFLPFSTVRVGGYQVQRESNCRIRDIKGLEYGPKIEDIVVESSGPLTGTVAVRGRFSSVSGSGDAICDFLSRLTFYWGLSVVRMVFSIRNPKAAKHRGGMWDLGDEGSIYFKDLSMGFYAGISSDFQVQWSLNPMSSFQSTSSGSFAFYQDSSGGEKWNSQNHVDRLGKITNSFRGYRIYVDEQVVDEGERASPVVAVRSGGIRLGVAIPYFWQNFPKALEIRNGELFVKLFPDRHDGDYELQGGEQKSHTIFLDYGTGEKNNEVSLRWVHEPLLPVVSPEWVASTEVFPYMIPREKDPNRTYNALIDQAVEGDRSFFERREIIDEYGWRNFGDLYADHETVFFDGKTPPTSHYNNQYDGIYGAILQYARSGREKWFCLAGEMARHVMDIDIYHTELDKPAFNGGLFWHTDHYVDVGTATHRCYSRKTKESKNLKRYGGGPSNEHLYTTGLLYFHYLTGDVQAKESVVGLADWVLAMEDGARTTFSLLSKGETGLASMTADKNYHGPGRGAGNAINALLDAYAATKELKYLDFAEHLIRRCIHPKDDIPGRNLLDHEMRWSYTVFLQVLGKYLDLKMDHEEQDFMFHYSRESLLHYADWMMENEVPFSQCLHRVEYPTETWIVHDLRKSNVLEVAARYSIRERKKLFLRKAEFFFEGCFRDLERFETRALTRPLVMMMSCGVMHSYFQNNPETHVKYQLGHFDFGNPQNFRPQRKIAIGRFKAIVGAAVILIAICIQRLFVG